MPSSVRIFSTRAISWIWNRTVSTDSKTTVMIPPNPTRRSRLRSITRARKSSRARSYARASRMSSRVRWSVGIDRISSGRHRSPAARPRRAGRVTGRSGSGDRLEALREPAGVGLLGPGQRLEPLRDLVEALVAGGLGEAGVHLRVLVRLAFDGRLEVVRGGADWHAGDGVADLAQEVEVAERVAGLALGDG